jgi:hypothetical protein
MMLMCSVSFALGFGYSDNPHLNDFCSPSNTQKREKALRVWTYSWKNNGNKPQLT